MAILTRQTTGSGVTNNAAPLNNAQLDNNFIELVGQIASKLPLSGGTVTGALQVDGNTTLGDASTDTVTVNGYIGVGGAAGANVGVYVKNAALTGSTQHGIVSSPVGSAAGTADISAFSGVPGSNASAYTATNAYSFWAFDAIKGSGSTITNLHGLFIRDQTQGTNNYGITSLVSSGTNKWNIYASGTAANYFAGDVGFGTSSISSWNSTWTAAQFAGSGFIAGRTGVTDEIYIGSNAYYSNAPAWIYSATDYATLYLSDSGTHYFRTAASGTAGGAITWDERLSIGQSGVVFNDPGNDYDFRVESDTNTHALFVQGSDGFVGIGTTKTNLSAKVEVVAGADLSNIIAMWGADTSTEYFSLGIPAAGESRIMAGGAATTSNAITFYTSASGTEGERLRITSVGNVLVGTQTDNSTDLLQVNGSVTGTILKSTVSSGTAPLTVESTTAVTNLNADLLDGQHGTYYLDWNNISNKPDPVVTVTLTGDVTGTANATLTDLASGTVTVATTIAANSVALGTDTTGNYVAGLTAGTGISISGTAGEGWSPTVTNSAPNVTTDISITHAASSVTVNSSDGTDGTINAATTSLAGVMTAADKTKLDGIATGATANTGTVTSVSGTGTVSGLSLSGTVTTSGNITLGGSLSVDASNFASQTAKTFLAAPNGAAGAPTFRTIVASDVPTLNQNTTGTASNVTGTVALANGGTGASLSDPNADRILFWDDSAGAVTWLTVSTGLSLSGTTLTATATGDVTLTGTQTLTNKTLTSPTINGGSLNDPTINTAIFNNGYTEEVFALSGTTPAIQPFDGSIQTWTLSGNSTPTAGTWASGQSITLMIDDGASYTINWGSLAVTWKTDSGSAPTLNTTGYTAIALWKVGTTIYGARVGDN